MTELEKEIERLLAENTPDLQIARVIKKKVKKYLENVPRCFAKSGGKDFPLRHTRKMDTVIRLVYKVATREMFGHYLPMKNHIPVTLVALGSYGREELCLYSDIDLMIVYEDIQGYKTGKLIEKVLYLLWDSGLKLAHRVHEVFELPEAARKDITIKTAILESRFIDGSKFLWTGIQNRINEIRKEKPDEFIRAKLEERERFHKKYPLTMEPHLKEGVGGFRDANMVYWISRLFYDIHRIKDLDDSIIDPGDYREFRMALEFLYRVRTALHIAAGKKTDRLRLELLPELAKLLKYDESHKGQLKLARKVTASLKTIHLYSEIWLETLISPLMPEIYNSYFLPEKSDRSLYRLIDILISKAHETYAPHPRLLKKLIHAEKPDRPDHRLYRNIYRIFEQPFSYSVLSAISDARLLGYLIPPMKQVTDLPQFDGYHRYTVENHSLETLRHIEKIEDPFIRKLFGKLSERERGMLKIVALLHDAGKGRKKDHREVGASLFRIFAGKLGMDADLVRMGEKLILYHTLMSTTAQREDIYSEKTVMRFCSRFGNRKMLDMIYILTCADIKGVGIDIYNDYTSRLLKTLYLEAIEAFRHEHLLDETSKRLSAIDRLQRSRIFKELPEKLKKKILAITSDAFFIRNSPKKIVSISTFAHESGEYRYLIHNERRLSVEIVRRLDLNLGYFLSGLNRLQVVNMEITKLFDGIKYFKIDFNESLDRGEIPRLEKIIKNSFRPHPVPKLNMPEIYRNEIRVDCHHSKEYATMTLRTGDQRGLLAYLIHLFDQLGVDIASAKIHTLKGKVNDLFLIEKNGNFCHNIELIIQKLTEKTCVES